MRPHRARLGDKTLRDIVILKCNKWYIWSLQMHDCWWMMTFAGRYYTCELHLQFFVFTCNYCTFKPICGLGLGLVNSRSCSHHCNVSLIYKIYSQKCRYNKEKKNIYNTISHYSSITRNTCTEFRFHTTLNFRPAVIRRYTYNMAKFIKLHWMNKNS